MKFLDMPRSGSYAGTTSSRNRYGQYIRNRATPVNPSSTYQQTVRARLSTVASLWKTCTAAQQAGWRDLGNSIPRNDSLGSSYTQTGFGAFCMCNINKLNAGDATILDAPAYAPPPEISTLTLTGTISTLSLAYTTTPLPASTRLFIFLSPQVSPGRLFNGNYRLISVTAAAAASPANLFTPYSTRFGAPVVGNKIFCSAQTYLAGWVSSPILTSLVV